MSIQYKCTCSHLLISLEEEDCRECRTKAQFNVFTCFCNIQSQRITSKVTDDYTFSKIRFLKQSPKKVHNVRLTCVAHYVEKTRLEKWTMEIPVTMYLCFYAVINNTLILLPKDLSYIL